MGAGVTIDSDDVGCAGTVHAHGSSNLVAASNAGELVAGPHAEDGADGEVGVDDGGAVERVEGNAESTCAGERKMQGPSN